MKAEYANIFVRAAILVFQKELKIHLSRQSLQRKNAPIPSLPVAIVLGVTGAMRGQVVYSVDTSFAREIAHAMIPNKLPSELKHYINSAVGEIGNMITGQASIELAGEDRKIHLTPPVVITGNNLKVDFLQVPTICLRMLSEMGVLEINIAFEDEQPTGSQT